MTMRLLLTVAFFVPACLVGAGTGWAQDTPGTRPSTGAATQPSAIPADEPPAVTQLLERVAAAYAAVDSLRMEGTVTGVYDAAGRRSRHEASFVSLAGGDGRFRHEVPGELVVAADEEATWVFFPAALRYYRTPRAAAATQPATPELPPVARQALLDHDLSLLLALSEDPAATLRSLGKLEWADGGLRATRVDGSVWEFEFEATTGLLGQVRIDEAEVLRSAGVPDVKVAMRGITYSNQPDAAIPPEALTFSPPETAQEVEPTQLAGGPSLSGQPAPELSLKDLEGKQVSLHEMRGKVVVVDFWASWCGPCVIAMPHLKTMAQEHAAEGFVVLAVNLREDQATVRQFVTEHGLEMEGVMVLSDDDGTTAERWGVQAIPFSVVVGRDGVVREVVVGVQPEKLTSAVAAALAERTSPLPGGD